MLADHEAVAHRRGDEPGPRGRSHERERAERHVDRAGGHAVAERDVDPEILHRRIEKFLDRDWQAVDFVDEEHRALGDIREIRQQVLGGRQGRTAGDLQRGAKLARDASGECRLAEPRRTVEQDVAERVATLPRRIDGDLEPLVDGPLAHHVSHALRPQRAVFGRLFLGCLDARFAK